MISEYIGDTIMQEILYDIGCKFTVFELPNTPTPNNDVVVYVDIEHLHDPCMGEINSLNISYTKEEYEGLVAKEGALLENLKHWYLNSHTFTRELDEYFH